MAAINPVITREQSKQITHGRTPLVPVQYEAAVKALAECINLDEAKCWSDKADALAAWAKIYRSDDAGRKARQLKLHAFRRMAVLAQELRPRKWRPGADNKRNGSSSGAKSLLLENGLKASDAVAATLLGRLPPKEFEELVNRPVPPTPISARAETAYKGTSEAWKSLVRTGNFERFCHFCINNNARAIARQLHHDEVDNARRTARRITDWLDEFDQCLPKTINR